jgi:hypothetical protein
LFNRLVEDFHVIAAGKFGDGGQVVEIVLHDHGFQSNPVTQMISVSSLPERIDGLHSSLEKIVAAADLRVSRAYTVQRNGNAPRVGKRKLLDLALIALT